MKQFLTFFVILLCITISSQAASPSDTTNLSVYKAFSSDISTLIKNLEGPAKHTYEIYVRQAVMDGYISLALLSGIIIILALVVYFCTKAYNKERAKHSYSYEDMYSACAIICAILLALFIFAFILSFSNNITQIVNPEYWAINKLLETVK